MPSYFFLFLPFFPFFFFFLLFLTTISTISYGIGRQNAIIVRLTIMPLLVALTILSVILVRFLDIVQGFL